MFESLFIVALVFAVYFKTFKFGIVVDDMRRYEEIKRGHFEKLNWQRFIERRFYGFGTLIRKNKDGKWFSEGKDKVKGRCSPILRRPCFNDKHLRNNLCLGLLGFWS